MCKYCINSAIICDNYMNHIIKLYRQVINLPRNNVQHYAAFFGKHWGFFGVNFIVSKSISVHAEIDAYKKYMGEFKINKTEMRKAVNLCVIRLTKTGVLGESRPCAACLFKLKDLAIKIKFVYYSTRCGKIAREKFSEMLETKIHISKGTQSSKNEMEKIGRLIKNMKV